MDGKITGENVGRVAERIVANELEYHGYRAIDLNKQGLAANADLLAFKGGKNWQIQVKGAENKEEDKWWVGYWFCNQAQIDDRKVMVFNPHSGPSSFYRADTVVLVAVLSPKQYRCIVLPVSVAEEVAQINLDGYYRTLKRDGTPHKPHKMYGSLDPGAREHLSENNAWRQRERELLLRYEDAWEFAMRPSP
jgi:hypothetical protein